MRKRAVTVNLGFDMYDKVEYEARRCDMTMSRMVRVALREYLMRRGLMEV